MKTNLILSLAILVATAGFEARADKAEHLYNAISMSSSRYRVASANNKKSAVEAMEAANRECGYKDCRVLVSSEDGCIALASSYLDFKGTQWFGLGKGTRKDEVEKLAVGNCEKGITELCVVHTSVCTYAEVPIDEEQAADIYALLRVVPEGSDDARGILKMVNTYAADFLAKEASLPASFVTRLKGYKGYFGTMTQFLKYMQLGEGTFDRLIGYARAQKYIK